MYTTLSPVVAQTEWLSTLLESRAHSAPNIVAKSESLGWVSAPTYRDGLGAERRGALVQVGPEPVKSPFERLLD